jgi:predicted dehydrogenase
VTILENIMEKLNVAILGAGNMGTCLARALKKVERAEISIVCDARPELAERLAKEVGATAVASLEEALQAPRVEAVLVCLPTFTRLEVLRKVVQAQKHIFTEKPLALNRNMAQALGALLKGYSKTVMVGQVVRFFWEYANLRRQILEGKIGQVGMVRLSRCVGYPGDDSWYTDAAKSGGIILDLLVHDLDFLLWTFGNVKQVYAQTCRSRRQGPLDYALLNLQLESGAIAHLEGSWAHPVGSFRQTVEVAGSEGLLHYDSAEAQSFKWHVTEEVHEGVRSRISIPEMDPENDPYFLEISHFVESSLTNRPVDIPWQEAMKACEVAFAAAESAEQGVPVDLAG